MLANGALQEECVQARMKDFAGSHLIPRGAWTSIVRSCVSCVICTKENKLALKAIT